MKLQKLVLKNFKGMRDFTLEPNGESIAVYGDNAIGKTTIGDAIVWILTDRDTMGRVTDDMGIKTLDENDDVIHGLDHSVEAVFDNVVLKKTYREKWTESRGAAEKEFTGHTTEYEVDGVPVKKKEYDKKIREIVDDELLRILTIPNYFAEELHWEKRRRILTEIAGEISTNDIIESHPELERYPEILNGKEEDDVIKILKSRKKKLNDSIDDIPIRIDEANRSITETGNVDEAKANIETLKKKRSTFEAKINEVQSGGKVAELKVRVQEIEAEKGRLKNEHQAKLDDTLAELRKKITELESRNDTVTTDLRTHRNGYAEAENELKTLAADVERLGKEIAELSAKEPLSDDEPDTCPYCEQPIPKEHNHEEYIAQFNQEKAQTLKRLNTELSEAQEKVAAKEKGLEEIKQKGLKISSQQKQIESAVAQKKTGLEEKKKTVTPVTDTDEYKKLVSEQGEIKASLENHQTEKEKQIEQLNESIAELNADIVAHEAIVYQSQQNDKTKARIKELNAERKRYATELEQVEADLNLIDGFIRVRSQLVTDRVNDKFRFVTWELFKELINGGVELVCEAYYKGKPFSQGASHSERVKAGLDILNTLSKHFGKSLPVVCDNIESVTKLPDMGDLQIIGLYVSKPDKKLRIGIQNKKQKEAA